MFHQLSYARDFESDTGSASRPGRGTDLVWFDGASDEAVRALVRSSAHFQIIPSRIYAFAPMLWRLSTGEKLHQITAYYGSERGWRGSHFALMRRRCGDR